MASTDERDDKPYSTVTAARVRGQAHITIETQEQQDATLAAMRAAWAKGRYVITAHRGSTLYIKNVTKRASQTAAALGRRGGRASKGSTSAAKRRASAANGRRGGRPRKEAS